MSSLHERLHRAHQQKRAEWAARGVIADPGIDLKRIKRGTRIRIMPWASEEAVQEIEGHMEDQPIIVPQQTSAPEAAPVPTEAEAQLLAAAPKAVALKLDIPSIAKFVAKHYGIAYADMLGPRRTANLVRPRQIAIYLAKKICQKSLPFTGRRFGGRDHTTILHATRKIERLKGESSAFAAEVDALEAEILSGTERINVD